MDTPVLKSVDDNIIVNGVRCFSEIFADQTAPFLERVRTAKMFRVILKRFPKLLSLFRS